MVTTSRRTATAIAAVLACAALAACSPGPPSAPSYAPLTAPGSATASGAPASPAATGDAPLGPQDWHYPALIPRQADDVVNQVQTALDAAITARSVTAAGPRLIGPAREVLAARLVIAAARKSAVPADRQVPQRMLIPRAGDWPRWFVAAGSDSASPTVALRIFSSASARTPYGLWGELNLLPGASLPAPADGAHGATQVAPDATGWRLSPLAAAAGYADVLSHGPKDPQAATFADDPLRRQTLQRQQRDAATLATAPGAALTSTHRVDPASVRALRLSDGSILVVAALTQAYVLTVGSTPLAADADLTALSGRATFTRRLERTAVELVALVVPPPGSQQIRLLAASKADVRAVGS
jgi:hypothetical protein